MLTFNVVSAGDAKDLARLPRSAGFCPHATETHHRLQIGSSPLEARKACILGTMAAAILLSKPCLMFGSVSKGDAPVLLDLKCHCFTHVSCQARDTTRKERSLTCLNLMSNACVADLLITGCHNRHDAGHPASFLSPELIIRALQLAHKHRLEQHAQQPQCEELADLPRTAAPTEIIYESSRSLHLKDPHVLALT